MSAFIDEQREPLRGRADLPDPGRVGVRLLPARDRRAVGPAGRGRQVARADPGDPRSQLLRLRLLADVEGAAARRRAGRPRPGRAADARKRHPGRQTPRQAVAHDRPRPGGACGRPTSSSATSPPAGPDELWFVDFTYLRCWEGVVFFAFVIDAYSRPIVGWQFADHMRTDLVLDALRMALALRRPGADVALIHHSDAGSPIPLERLQPDPRRPRRARLDRHASATPTTTPLAESFVDSFKTELIRDRVWRTPLPARARVVEYVAWFNNERLHTSLGGIPPAEYERQRRDDRVHKRASDEKRKPTKTVSAEPGRAHSSPTPSRGPSEATVPRGIGTRIRACAENSPRGTT